MTDFEKIIRGQLCPYCNCSTEIVSDKQIYGPNSSYNKMFYRCIMNHDHYVGTYHDNKKSLGRLANNELRLMKRKAHDAFDPLWRDEPSRFTNKYNAYQWLSEKMGIDLKYTHIGMFIAEECEKVIILCMKENNFFKSVDLKSNIKTNL